MVRKANNPPDFTMLITVYTLLAIGLVMVFSASQYMAVVYYEGDSLYFFKRQMAWSVLGLIGMHIAMRYGYYKLKRFIGPVFIVGFILLAVVLIPGVSRTTNGAQRWIDLGFVSFSPAEVFKLCMVLFFAYRLSKDGEKARSLKVFVQYLLVLALAALLILKQPDLGTAAVLCGTVFAMFFMAGSRISHFACLGGAGLALGIAAILKSPYRRERLLSFLHRDADPQGAGYHLTHSIYALASGGFWGSGLGQGKEKYLYLPECHTDFIFAVIGEETGFLGAALIVLLFGVLIWRGYKTAILSNDPFASLLAGGITSYIALQAFINMGMVTGCLPVTGVPLPLVSYGGTSLLFTLLGIGMVLNISKYAY